MDPAGFLATRFRAGQSVANRSAALFGPAGFFAGDSGIGSLAGVLAGFVLAGVFVWAGAAKLARPQATATAFSALGVPVPNVAARAVPIVELTLAVALVAAPRVGGAVALVALVGFSLVLLRALGAGTSAGCNCFGRSRPEPVSRRDLLRNATLAGLALLAALAGCGPT